eukprot:c25390_g1_i2 orf=108-470(+)
MDTDASSAPGNGNMIDGKVWQTFETCFSETQTILDRNRILINEINQNHDSKLPDNLRRNVTLIRELNSNIARVVELYKNLSTVFVKFLDPSSQGESTGTVKADSTAAKLPLTSGHKRIRS